MAVNHYFDIFLTLEGNFWENFEEYGMQRRDCPAWN